MPVAVSSYNVAVEHTADYVLKYADVNVVPSRYVAKNGVMKRFPTLCQDTEKSFFEMVAGARFAHQKRNSPPIDVIDIQFEYQGSALVPVKA